MSSSLSSMRFIIDICRSVHEEKSLKFQAFLNCLLHSWRLLEKLRLCLQVLQLRKHCFLPNPDLATRPIVLESFLKKEIFSAPSSIQNSNPCRLIKCVYKIYNSALPHGFILSLLAHQLFKTMNLSFYQILRVSSDSSEDTLKDPAYWLQCQHTVELIFEMVSLPFILPKTSSWYIRGHKGPLWKNTLLLTRRFNAIGSTKFFYKLYNFFFSLNIDSSCVRNDFFSFFGLWKTVIVSVSLLDLAQIPQSSGFIWIIRFFSTESFIM